MKKTIMPLLCSALLALAFTACNKEVKDAEPTTEVDAATIALIKAKGFSTHDVQRTEGGYLVEGDILLTDADLNSTTTSPSLLIAQTEQYRTTNLVKFSGTKRYIKVAVSGTVSQRFSDALNETIRRYNAEKLVLEFSRVSTGADILIRIVNTRQYIASAGFPTSTGDPHNEIKYAKAYSDLDVNFMATVLAHELGHCIGFRHTDYMDRSYSCGGGYSNEGASTVGAIHIPGTPTTADPNSWMLACIGSGQNRPFNANDKTALSYLY